MIWYFGHLFQSSDFIGNWNKVHKVAGRESPLVKYCEIDDFQQFVYDMIGGYYTFNI